MENALKSAGWGGCDRVFYVGVAEKKTGNTETTYLYINHLLCIHIQPTSVNYNCTIDEDDHEIGELFQCNLKFN